MKDQLKEIRQTPNQEVIKALETALELAKSGEVQGIAVVQIWDDGGTTHWWRLEKIWMSKASHVIGEAHCLMTGLSNSKDGIYADINRLKGD